MRILIFHGYLLSGTGSNVYNANLAAALRRAGHEVHLFSQDRHPERLDFVDAVGEWHEGRLTVRTLREPVRCTAYRPDIGPVLPVYVADRYEGVDATALPRAQPAGARPLPRREHRGGARGHRAGGAGHRAGQPPRHGPGDPRSRPRGIGALRRGGPRLGPGVHGQTAPPLPPVRARRPRRRPLRARRLAPHRREPVDGARRPRPPRADAPRPTRGGHRGLPRPRPRSRGGRPARAGRTPRRATTVAERQVLLHAATPPPPRVPSSGYDRARTASCCSSARRSSPRASTSCSPRGHSCSSRCPTRAWSWSASAPGTPLPCG